MKILLIVPEKEKTHDKVQYYIEKSKIHYPYLGLPILAALTPPEHEVKIIDENHGTIEKFEEADLVGITALTMNAKRAYTIADTYRSMNIPVVFGGIHASACVDEALEHFDSVAVGEGEDIWPELLKDFEKKDLKRVYYAKDYPDMGKIPIPRRDLIDGPAYRFPNGILYSIQATRGCPNNCNFCSVTAMFGRKFRTRPISNVIREIEAIDATNIVFADDNIAGNIKYAEELFTALIPYKKRWFAQSSLKITQYPHLLKLAKESGCFGLYIGIETLNKKNLELINKISTNKIEQYEDAMALIHDQGIEITGSFIVGLDNDDESVFDSIYEFIMENKIDNPVICILTPLPRTALFHKLKEENRILTYDWNKYNLTEVVFKPKNMSPETLTRKYEELHRAIIYNHPHFVEAKKKIINSWKHTQSRFPSNSY